MGRRARRSARRTLILRVGVAALVVASGRRSRKRTARLRVRTIHDAEPFHRHLTRQRVTSRPTTSREVETRFCEDSVVGQRPVPRAVVVLGACGDHDRGDHGTTASPMRWSEQPSPGRKGGSAADDVRSLVNDVHFGEWECGRLGPRSWARSARRAGRRPHPRHERSDREIERLIRMPSWWKGDLTDIGSDDQYASSPCVEGSLARMHHVRGNHDAMLSDTIALPLSRGRARWRDPAMPDTVRPKSDRAHREQPAGMAGGAGASTKPVLVFGHHHPWDPRSAERNESLLASIPKTAKALRVSPRGDQ